MARAGPYSAFVDCLQLLACCALCNVCFQAAMPRERIVVVRDTAAAADGELPLVAVSNVSIER